MPNACVACCDSRLYFTWLFDSAVEYGTVPAKLLSQLLLRFETDKNITTNEEFLHDDCDVYVCGCRGDGHDHGRHVHGDARVQLERKQVISNLHDLLMYYKDNNKTPR